MPYAGMARTPPWLFVSELKRTYDVQVVPPSEENIATNIGTLLLLQPVELTESTRYAIDQFVLRGGRLIAFIDPLCIADQEASGEMFTGQSKDLSGFLNLMKNWGLGMDPQKVAADLTYATRIMNEQRVATRNTAWLSLRDAAIDRTEVATSPLESVMLVGSGVITGQPVAGLTMTTLLKTSAQSGLVDAMMARMSDDGGLSKLSTGKVALPLAVRLQGTFHTAFPNGRPPAPPAEGDQGQKKDEAPGLKEGDGVVVIVADVDLLYNRFMARSMNFLGQSFLQPLNDNLNFAVNLVEQLSGNPALISLRSRGSFQRPFTRVLDMEQNAADRWRQQETALQDKLEAARARLTELQTQKDPKQQYIRSPEQKREIEQFRKEQFETSKALREVRKNLRRDVDRLGLQLQTLNMAAVPILVALFGLVFVWRHGRG